MNVFDILDFKLKSPHLNEGCLWNPYTPVSTYDPSTDDTVVEWLKADGTIYAKNTGDPGTQCVNNDLIGVWKKSKGYDALPYGDYPTFKSNFLNSKPVVFFDNAGAPGPMQVASLAVSQPTAYWIVAKSQTATGAAFLFDGTNSRQVFLISLDSTYKWDAFAGAEAFTGSADTGWHIFYITFNDNGSSHLSSVTLDNGTVTYNLTTGSSSLDGLFLCRSNISGTTPGWYIAEIIIQNAIPNSGAIAAIRNYLNGRWAIY
jgi:hypothetical protein